MLINIVSPSGIAPIKNPRTLAATQAQIAQNCKMTSGGIEALPNHTLIYNPQVTGVKSIYRFLHTRTNDSEYWFAWDKEVNVVKGQVAGDTDERTYFTGTGKPRKTSVSVGALNAVPYPGAHLEMGVPRPTVAPVVTVVGGDVDGEIKETRAYVYTYVTSFGDLDEESAPSPAVIAEGYPSNTWNLSNFLTMPAGEFNFKSIRVYRTAVGNASTNYLLTAEKLNTNNFADSTAATALGEALPSLEWDNVPGCSGNTDEIRELQGLISLPNGVHAGFVGNDVYLSPAYRPHTFPQAYMNSVDYPVVALGALQSNLLVLTTGQPYMIAAADPENTTIQKVDINQSCASARSVAKFGNGVMYASPDGLVYIGIDGSRIATEDLFSRDKWQKLKPTTMHGCQFDGKYYGWFSGATLPGAPANGGFIFDGQNFTLTDVYATASFVDMVQDALFVAIGDRVHKWESAGTKLTYTWKSRLWQTPQEVNFSAAQVIAEDYTDVSFKLYANGSLVHTEAVTSDLPFRLPSGFLATRFEIELTGTSTVLQAAMAESMEELGGV